MSGNVRFPHAESMTQTKSQRAVAEEKARYTERVRGLFSVGGEQEMGNRFLFKLTALAVAMAMVVLGAGVALADEVRNDLVATSAGKIASTKKGAAIGVSVGFSLFNNNDDSTDGRSGCNPNAGNPATLSFSNLPAGVTVSPATTSMIACDVVYSVAFKASNSATVGNHEITPSVTGGRTGSGYNTTTGKFTLKVESDNTAPTVQVTGVSHRSSYQYGGVPAAGCSVVDAEDSNESASPQTGAISGPGANLGLGSQTTTCSYTDGGGLTGSATATYSIVDTTAPVVTVPGDVTKEATSGSGATASWSAPSATDNVPNQTLTVACDKAAGSSFPPGSTKVTCRSTDASGNEGVASFNVSVVDTTAPAVTVPQNLVLEATSADGAEASWSGVSASDIVDGALEATCDYPSGASFPLGVTTVTCSATDNATNLGSSTFTVSVLDEAAPSMPALENVSVEATSADGAVAGWQLPDATDAVDGSVPLSCDASSGDSFPLGVTTVTCSATDAAENASAEVGFTVTVTDTTAPLINLPQGPTLEATGPDGAEATFAGEASDMVDGSLPVSCDPLSGSTFSLGSTTVNCSATDSAGNSSSDSLTVTVVDTTAPSLTVPQDLTREATSQEGADVDFAASASDIVAGETTISCVPAGESTFPLGKTKVTCSSSDGQGNSASENFHITVEDTTAPAVTVPDNITTEATSAAGATVTFDSTSSDLVDGDITPSCTPAPGSPFELGQTTVTCGATDLSNNLGSDSFKVNVVDTTKPEMTLPADITLEATGPDGADATWTLGKATDIVDGELDIDCNKASGHTFAVGSTDIDCSATDNASNTTTDSFTVTVLDTTAPEVTVPDNITEEATSSAGAVATWTGVSASDIVDGDVITTCDADSGDTFPLDVTTITCSATDGAGNTGTNAFTVSVFDRTAPAIPALESMTEEATGSDGAEATWTLPQADDAVDGKVDLDCDRDSGDTFELGITTVTCTATDAKGNKSQGGFNVTVQDTTAPSLTVPDDKTVEATSADGAVVSYQASASDIVDGSLTPDCSPASGTTLGLTTTTVTCSVTDEAGNNKTKTFTITVQDTTAPALTLPDDITKEATGPDGATVSYTASASDIVDGSVQPTCLPASDTKFALGTTTVNCEVIDVAGNESSKAFNVKVVDTTAPEGITFVGILEDGSSHLFKSVPGKPTCTATDSASGLKECVVTGYSSQVGNHRLTATATDNEGNQDEITLSYRVLPWTLTGLFSPVDMTPAGSSTTVYNTVKGGSTVPLKFELFSGATELKDVAEITTRPSKVSCTPGNGDPVEVLAPGGTVLRYDSTAGQFIFNWKTPAEPGACYKVVVGSSDGSTSVAHFKLK